MDSPLPLHPFFVGAGGEERAVSAVVERPGNCSNRRATPRRLLTVPASVTVGTQDFTAKLANIVPDGAMLETAASVVPGSKITLRCGSIAAVAEVVWIESRACVKFRSPVSEVQIQEQMLRSATLEARRKPKQS